LTRLQQQRDALEQQLARARGARLEIGVALQGAVDFTLCGQRIHLRHDLRAGSVQFNADGAMVHVDSRGFADPLPG